MGGDQGSSWGGAWGKWMRRHLRPSTPLSRHHHWFSGAHAENVPPQPPKPALYPILSITHNLHNLPLPEPRLAEIQAMVSIWPP